jgi:hypothetical protein
LQLIRHAILKKDGSQEHGRRHLRAGGVLKRAHGLPTGATVGAPVDAGQPVLEMIAQAAALTSAGLRLAALTDLPQAGKA